MGRAKSRARRYERATTYASQLGTHKKGQQPGGVRKSGTVLVTDHGGNTRFFILLLTNSGALWTRGIRRTARPPQTARQAPLNVSHSPSAHVSGALALVVGGWAKWTYPQRLAARRLFSSEWGTTLSYLPNLDHSLLCHPHTFAVECNFYATNSGEITAALMHNRIGAVRARKCTRSGGAWPGKNPNKINCRIQYAAKKEAESSDLTLLGHSGQRHETNLTQTGDGLAGFDTLYERQGLATGGLHANR
jgi:hypothetical protein